jgi:hypothetical protein
MFAFQYIQLDADFKEPGTHTCRAGDGRESLTASTARPDNSAEVPAGKGRVGEFAPTREGRIRQ